LYFNIKRFSLKYLLTGSFNKSGKDKENILIYGAGAAGRQLFTSLEGNSKYNVVGFLDDNPNCIDKIYWVKEFMIQKI
jgi:FlaA1/EpsC-like NDP-sugar epimerase